MGNAAQRLFFACVMAALGCACEETDGSMTDERPPFPQTALAGRPVTGGAAGSPSFGANMTETMRPATMEAATTVYVEQSSQVLAGGGIQLVYDFVLLFGDGWSTWRMGTAALETPAADRSAKPDSWVKWRRNAQGRPERLLKGDKWTAVPGVEYKPSAPGRTLNATYSYTQVYQGGAISRSIRLSSNGRFETANKQGTYRIDGYVLTLTLPDGKTEKYTIVISSGEEMIIFNGTGYIR